MVSRTGSLSSWTGPTAAPWSSPGCPRGTARTPLFDGAPLTLTSEAAVEAARLLAPAVIVPVHTEGWAHFSEGPDVLAKAFADAGLALQLPPAGESLSL